MEPTTISHRHYDDNLVQFPRISDRNRHRIEVIE
jgi:hypothetical protein